MPKKGPESEMGVRSTKTTVNLPSDVYGDVWQLIVTERMAGRKLTAQEIMVDALREYIAARKKEAAA